MSLFSPALRRLIIAAGTLLMTNGVLAGAFQLYEESAAGTGNYHAGGAAEADDASTEFYNPAGMIRINNQEISIGAVLLPVSLRFNGFIAPAPNVFLHTPGSVAGDTVNFIPNLHYVRPLSPDLAFGFGVTAPFGLSTDYSANVSNIASIGATKSQLIPININPNLAYAFNQYLSIGAGFDFLYADAELDNLIPPTPPLFPGALKFTNTLSGVAPGYNVGVLLQLSECTRFGLTYRSKMIIRGTGSSQIDGMSPLTPGAPAVLLAHTDVSANVALPPSTEASFYHDVTEQLAVMASAQYTQWDVFKNITLNNVALRLLLPAISTIIVPEDYNNSWNFALGGNYRITPKTMIKLGGGYDETPTKNGFRDIRLPDANRWALAAGIHIDETAQFAIDAGYTHFFSDTGRVNNILAQAGTPVPLEIGTAQSNINVFGLQFSYKFC